MTRVGYVSSRTEKTIKAESVIEFAKVPSLEPVRVICSVFTIALGYKKCVTASICPACTQKDRKYHIRPQTELEPFLQGTCLTDG